MHSCYQIQNGHVVRKVSQLHDLYIHTHVAYQLSMGHHIGKNILRINIQIHLPLDPTHWTLENKTEFLVLIQIYILIITLLYLYFLSVHNRKTFKLNSVSLIGNCSAKQHSSQLNIKTKCISTCMCILLTVQDSIQ